MVLGVEKHFSRLFQRDITLQTVQSLQQRVEEDVNDGRNQGQAAGRASGGLYFWGNASHIERNKHTLNLQ